MPVRPTTSADPADEHPDVTRTTADDVLARLERAFPGGRVNRLDLPAGRRLVIDDGRGARVTDHAGRSYIDYLLSSGPLIIGHAHPHVVDAIRRRAERGTSFHLPSLEALELAERVIGLVPCAEQVRFCGSGSEATMFALRLARAATGRDAVLKLEGAFHGNHDSALMSLAPSGAAAYPTPEPSSSGIPDAATGTC